MSHQTVSDWEANLYHYRAELLRVIDGDTIRVRISVGLHMYRDANLRIAEIDAPELYRGIDEERARGATSKAYLEQLLYGLPLYLETIRDTTSFDRFIAHVFVPQGESLISIAGMMVEAGYAEWSRR